MATDVGKDVIEFHGEDDQQKDRAVVPIVCHVAKVAERASEKRETRAHPGRRAGYSLWVDRGSTRRWRSARLLAETRQQRGDTNYLGRKSE